MNARQVLLYIQGLIQDATKAPKGDYRSGYLTALDEVEEYIVDQMWEEGEQEEEEP